MARSHPLLRLAREQKRDLSPLVDETERAVRDAFAQAQGEVAQVIADFAEAYQKEFDRINADRDEDQEPEMRKVPVTWLTSSGWGKRVQHALAMAAHRAGQKSLAQLSEAHTQAVALGTDHARVQMQVAMQPAVDAMVHRKRHVEHIPAGRIRARQRVRR